MKNLTPISIKIKDFLLSQGIKEEEILDVLGNIYRNIYDNYSVDVEIEDVYFNLVRDTVWYNLERSDGEYTLASYGKHFPVFMNMCEDGNEVSELSELYRELKKINEYFNTRKIYICTISGGDIHFNKDSKIRFLDKRENKIEKKTKGDLVCMIKEDMSAYKMEEIKIYSVIETLMQAIEKADKRKIDKLVIKFI